MYDVIYGVIIVVTMVACAWTSYKIGRRDGAESLIEILHHQKIIAYDEKGNIKPNPWFETKD